MLRIGVALLSVHAHNVSMVRNAHTSLVVAVCLCMLLGSCGSKPNAPGVGGVTKAQAEELNQAAEVLDARTNQAQAAAGSH